MLVLGVLGRIVEIVVVTAAAVAVGDKPVAIAPAAAVTVTEAEERLGREDCLRSSHCPG